MNILAKYLRRSDPAFLEETYLLVRTYTERIPRFDSRAIPVLLEFDPVKGRYCRCPRSQSHRQQHC